MSKTLLYDSIYKQVTSRAKKSKHTQFPLQVRVLCIVNMWFYLKLLKWEMFFFYFSIPAFPSTLDKELMHRCVLHDDVSMFVRRSVEWLIKTKQRQVCLGPCRI